MNPPKYRSKTKKFSPEPQHMMSCVSVSLVEGKLGEAYVEGTDVILSPYIAAFEELNKIFQRLGKVFTFVSSDVEKKIAILQRKIADNPDNYMSLQIMIKYETENDHAIIHADKENGCRTLLRLHRALAFVAHFIAITLEKEEEDLRSYVRDAYQETLAQHHTWIIRTSVGAAMHTLPYRRDIICLFDFTPEQVKDLIKVMWNVYNLTQRLYEDHHLLDLK